MPNSTFVNDASDPSVTFSITPQVAMDKTFYWTVVIMCDITTEEQNSMMIALVVVSTLLGIVIIFAGVRWFLNRRALASVSPLPQSTDTSSSERFTAQAKFPQRGETLDDMFAYAGRTSLLATATSLRADPMMMHYHHAPFPIGNSSNWDFREKQGALLFSKKGV